MIPHLSIVVVGRNDNYGGNFLHQFQLFINNQVALWERFGLNAELIIVEWNPPADKLKFKDALQWPQKLNFGQIKIIEVPPEVHKIFPKWEKIKLFEYVGKNVGVRRAQGEFILTTNCDLLYPPELIKFFADKKLQKNAVYRVDRYDFDGAEIPLDITPEEQIKIAKKYLLYINNPYGAAFLPNEKFWQWRNIRRQLTRLKNNLTHFPHQVPYMNAAGDFFLMHRQHWNYLKGFAELEHLNFPDALCYSALAGGLKQINLQEPLCVYHKEHQRGSYEKTGRPLSDAQVHKKAYLKMLRQQKPWIPNGDNWGLKNENLPEWKII